MAKGKIRPSARSLLSIAGANLDSWVRSPRTLLMLLFVFAMCYVQIRGFGVTLDRVHFTMHFGETLFYELNIGCNMPVTSILFLITISELPRRISFQNYSLIRSTRRRWLNAQILYCLFMVFIMIILMVLCVSAFSVLITTPGEGWSDTERIANKIILPEEALIESYIRERFTPLTANLIALLPIFLFWFTMVMVVLFCSLIGAPIVGVMLYAFLLTANVTILFEAIPGLSLPMHFATLKNITAGYKNAEMLHLIQTLCGYFFINILLITAMHLRIRFVDLNFYADNRL